MVVINVLILIKNWKFLHILHNLLAQCYESAKPCLILLPCPAFDLFINGVNLG
jgi:hypothetical protein